MPLSLTFVAGTLELRGLAADAPAPVGCRWDPRAACHRAPAIAYAELVDRWSLVADLRWGTARTPLRCRLDGRGEPDLEATPHLADDVRALLDALGALDTPWRASPAVEVLDLPGHGVCVPDLTFEHAHSGERVHLEVLGYWSRDAVWKRVELVQAGLAHRIVFAVGQQLRVSEAALDAELPGALYVYKRTMSARAILERLDPLAAIHVPAERGRARR